MSEPIWYDEEPKRLTIEQWAQISDGKGLSRKIWQETMRVHRWQYKPHNESNALADYLSGRGVGK